MENSSKNKVFGKYEIIDQLAVGGMGQIYLARQHDTYGIDRLVILKSLFPEMARDKECVKMFLDEARIASNLNHPNIVSIYEIGAWEGNYFLAMEYIRGEPLSHLVKRSLEQGAPVPVSFVISIVHDSCAALAYAHKATNIAGEALDLVHRDISPQNIMLSDTGILKVVDFGIARAANRYTQTYAGQIKGKITYMSPEQLRGAELDGRSDQHALGTVLWELIAGQTILKNDMSTTDVLDWKLNNSLPRLSGQREDIPIQIDSIIAKMTANDPEKRYQTTLEAKDALKELLVAYPELSSEKLGAWVTELAGERIKKRHAKIAARTADFESIGEEKTPEPQAPLTLNPTPAVSAAAAEPEPKRTKKTGQTPLLLGVFLLVTAITAGILYLSAPKTEKSSPVELAAEAVVKTALLSIETEPGNATIYIDGINLGQSPMNKLTLPANNDIDVSIRLEKHKERSMKIKLQAGEHRSMQIGLEPSQEVSTDVAAEQSPEPLIRTPDEKKERPKQKSKPKARTKRRKSSSPPAAKPQAAQEEGFGFLSLKSTPWTQVYIDGADYGLTPLYKKQLRTGIHQLEMRNPQQGILHKQQITIRKDKNLKLDLKL